jgi:hypothetical protein
MTKTKIVLSTLIAVGFASTAMATEPLNARIGDSYPFLEQRYPMVEQPTGALGFASADYGAFAFASAEYNVQGSAAAQWQQPERTGVNPNEY